MYRTEGIQGLASAGHNFADFTIVLLGFIDGWTCVLKAEGRTMGFKGKGNL